MEWAARLGQVQRGHGGAGAPHPTPVKWATLSSGGLTGAQMGSRGLASAVTCPRPSQLLRGLGPCPDGMRLEAGWGHGPGDQGSL